MKRILFLSLSLLLILSFSLQANVVKYEKNVAWVSFRDLSSAEFGQKFKEYQNKGYLMIDIDVYKVGSGVRYAMVWRENSDKRGWAEYRDMSSDAYNQRWTEMKNKGYRPIDIESYRVNGQQRYAGIWVQNKEDYGWSSKRNLTGKDYGDYFQEQRKRGYRLIDMEAYSTSQGLRYSAIWVQNKEKVAWAQLQYRDEGYRLVDFERDGNLYSGIWLENNSRFRYSKKKQLDNIISKYREDNNLPGISVAIIKDGQMIYRKGFGFADMANRKVAHGETVYNSASVSKTVAGVIAAKFQEEGRMQNGRQVNLNLNNATRSYLTNIRTSNGSRVTLPEDHQHTVAQLFAHIACIQHYDGPEPRAGHYNRAIDAVSQIWNASFLSSCTLGRNRNYSTHAYAYIAAVLEAVSGRTSAQLIQSEIARPYGLSSMRAQWASTRVPANYERAVPYLNDNRATNTSDNSWKMFGGGIEISTVDLARYGWKILNGEIVDANTRDNVLWNRVSPRVSRSGIGWDVVNANNRRVAEHGGSWAGALCRIRIYRDDGLVIAIMSNRRGHTVGNPATLSTSLANVVL